MSPSRPAVPRSLLLLGRVVGAGLLAVTAGIHLYLWDAGYRTIAWIGPLFLVQGVTACLLCLAVLTAPELLRPHVAVLGVLLQVGTLVGLLLSVDVGLLGFFESTRARLFWPSVWVEITGAVVLAAVAVVRPRGPVDAGVLPREVPAG
jgi:hypothetical protein